MMFHPIKIKILIVLAASMLLFGCGGGAPQAGQPQPSSQLPQIAGSWEIKAVSNNTPAGLASQQTYIETVISQTNGNWQGNSTQLVGFGFPNTASDFSGAEYQVGGFCGATSIGLSGTISSAKAVTFALNESGIVFNGTGTLSSDGTTILGSYTGGSGSCLDSGQFLATKTNSLNGNFSFNLIGDPSVQLSLKEGAAAQPPTLPTMRVLGSDSVDGSFTLNGNAVGNAAVVSGTIGGQPVTYYGLLLTHASFRSVQDTTLLLVVDADFSLVGLGQQQ